MMDYSVTKVNWLVFTFIYNLLFSAELSECEIRFGLISRISDFFLFYIRKI